MFAVTLPAVLRTGQPAVQRFLSGNLAADIRMTVLAARTHRLTLPRRNMAGRAIIRQLRMGADAIQPNPNLAPRI